MTHHQTTDPQPGRELDAEKPTDRELDEQIDQMTCDGLLVGRVVDMEGNDLDCFETNEPVGDWCATCVLRERLARALAAVEKEANA